jgi:hypothetical protein
MAAAVCDFGEGESPGGKALVFRDFLIFPGIRNWGSIFSTTEYSENTERCSFFSVSSVLWYERVGYRYSFMFI